MSADHNKSDTQDKNIRELDVTFGNPALGTYEGKIFIQCSNYGKHNETSPRLTSYENQLAAMIHVPPEQVPEGVLNLVRAHRSFIKHVRIVISSDSLSNQVMNEANPKDHDQNEEFEKNLSFPTLSAPAASKPNTSLPSNNSEENRNTVAASSVLPSPSASAMESAAAIFASDPTAEKDEKSVVVDAQFRHQLLQSSDNESMGDEGRAYIILFVLDSPAAAEKFVQHLNNQPYTCLDETQVAQIQPVVKLEGSNGVNLLSPFFKSPSLDSSSQHCMISKAERDSTNTLEVHNCAVCLEPLLEDENAMLTTVCNHSFHLSCYWQCMDSPCPVCRYDHSGLNDSVMLSQCHICGSTQHNYVCLICGVVSCASSSSRAASHNQDEQSNSYHNTDENSPFCSRGHARDHYDETLHAYALDTETQHVWDFCGRGYVHRLIQNAKDGKLVETAQGPSRERLPEAGSLSDRQEDEVVHRKLEGFANQYYTLLKSQLEQQRIYYDGRLEELRREHEQHQKGVSKNGENTLSSSATLIQALKQERHQMQQRLERLRGQQLQVSDDVSFLKNLNESLETNKEQMKRQIQEAQRERAASREMLAKSLPPLELKVKQLMLQLEKEGDLGSMPKANST